MVPESLTQVLAELKVPFAAVADLSSGETEYVGSPQAIAEGSHLLNTLFGDSGSIHNLDQSLNDSLMPRMLRQGDVSCVVCKPTPTVIVGMFMQDDRDVRDRYAWSISAEAALRRAYSQ